MSKYTSMQLLYLPKWSKLNKAGKAPIILRITINSVRASFSTGLFTTRAGWNQGKEELRGTAEDVKKTISPYPFSKPMP